VPAAGAQPTSSGLRVDEPADGVLRVLLDRPQRRNALDADLVAALHAAVADVAEHRAVVLGSATPGIFCAGADLDMEDAERAAVSDRLYELYGRIAAAPVPFIAAIDGAAVGGGAQLAIACDLRVVGPAARLRFVGAGHGLAVGAWALTSLVGRGERAASNAQAEALALAAEIARLDPTAVAHLKAVAAAAGDRREALAVEASLNRPWSGAMTASAARA
jgi:Enoyl-CoA hydratase/isomerase